MLSKKEEFKLKLKNCKSLEDYRLLSEEYNMEVDKSCLKYRERVTRQSIRERLKSVQII
jgi:hypothetical protein|tara:strand:- start:2139 stop:2315 length:177 start_codon:yes stop_codon:yes gene_type:complete